MITQDEVQESVLTPTESLGEQEWMDPASEAVEGAILKTFQAGGPVGQSIKDSLHGVWMGHPLHPALTDVPVGAWTATLVLDVMEASGQKEMAPGADATLAVGLVGALGAAVAGITDYSELGGEKRAQRIGLAHGLMNGTAALLYASSLAIRRRGGDRGLARALSGIGYGLVFTSAYLGGHLVYNEKIGVDHQSGIVPPEEFTPVMDEADLPEGQIKKVEADGAPVLLARVNGEIHALAETCPHLGGPLSEGKLEGHCVSCPWHGSTFSLLDGHTVHGPSAYPAMRLQTRVRDGRIEVKAMP